MIILIAGASHTGKTVLALQESKIGNIKSISICYHMFSIIAG